MEDDGWYPPATIISKVVEMLRSCLGKSRDSDKFKGTFSMLDLLEKKLKFLGKENLQRVSIDREQQMEAWLRQMKVATDDAVKLITDMEAKLVPEAGESTTPDIMTWFHSDSSSLLRMKYTIGRLVSVCTEGESILGMPNLDEYADESVMNDSASLMPDYSNVVGRDKEIAMILDVILDDACFQAATSIENWESADSLHISQKGWIIKTLQNISLSQQSQQDAEAAPYQKELGGTVEYTRVDSNTVSEMRNPTVIPMVGISGVGKTALAQFIFNDKRVQKHFQDQSAWVYCTDSIRIEELMTKILVSLQPQHKILAHGCDPNRLHNQLQSCIEGKRFLLVLDDVSDEIRAIWGDLRSVLSKGAPGSIILVTTQLYGVVSFIGTTTPIFLDPLQYDDLWKIFKHHAFSNYQSTEVLESTGKKIAHKLHGLPLAATMIGLSFRNYLDELHWDNIVRSWWWNVSSNSLGVHVAASLGVCYSELPAYLRQCLVYCSIFPRNYIFEKQELVQMWIANGFIELNNSSDPRSLEDVAAEWFDELVNRCFLQPTIWTLRYVMHDLVRDFAVALTSNEYCGVGSKLVDLPQSIRHLSIDMDNMNMPWADCNIKNLRSLMWFGGFHDTNSGEGYNTADSLLERSYDIADNISEGCSDSIDTEHTNIILRRPCVTIESILKRSTSLRLLNLSNMRLHAALACIDDCPLDEDHIAVFVKFIARHCMLPFLTHLRYLDFSYSGITKLPDALCTLCNLQVLGLRGCRFTQLPKRMTSLISLRHLHADADTISLIRGIGELTKLQNLHEFRVKALDGHKIAELRYLNSIRGSLRILNLEKVNDPWDVLQANIDEKHYLTDLELKWSNNIRFEDTRTLYSAEKLVGKSPMNLRVLKLFGYPGDVFPYQVGQLKHIRVIEITSCKRLQISPPSWTA